LEICAIEYFEHLQLVVSKVIQRRLGLAIQNGLFFEIRHLVNEFLVFELCDEHVRALIVVGLGDYPPPPSVSQFNRRLPAFQGLLDDLEVVALADEGAVVLVVDAPLHDLVVAQVHFYEEVVVAVKFGEDDFSLLLVESLFSVLVLLDFLQLRELNPERRLHVLFAKTHLPVVVELRLGSHILVTKLFGLEILLIRIVLVQHQFGGLAFRTAAFGSHLPGTLFFFQEILFGIRIIARLIQHPETFLLFIDRILVQKKFESLRKGHYDWHRTWGMPWRTLSKEHLRRGFS